MNHDIGRDERPRHWLFSKGTVVACIVLAVVGFLILTGHRAHLLGALPYLLLLACPLMHLFMHGGHHKDGNGSGSPPGKKDSSSWD